MPPAVKKEPIDYGKDVLAVLLAVIAIFVVLCLVSYHPADPALNSMSNVKQIKNLGGVVGAYTSDILLTIFGISAYVVAVLLFLMSLLQLVGRRLKLRVREVVFYLFLLFSASALFHLRFETIDIRGHAIAGGGMIGGLIGELLVHYLNRSGAALILSASVLLFFMLSTHITLVSIGDAIYVASRWIGRIVGRLAVSTWGYAVKAAKKVPTFVKTVFSVGKQIAARAENSVEISTPAQSAPGEETVTMDGETVRMEPIRASKVVPIRSQAGAPAKSPQAPAPIATTANQGDAGPMILARADLKPHKKRDDQLKFMQMNCEGYTPPPLSLLDAQEKPKIKIDEEALKKQSQFLEKKLMDFEVEGKVTAIHPGPVITTYEFEPAIGTKINRSQTSKMISHSHWEAGASAS